MPVEYFTNFARSPLLSTINNSVLSLSVSSGDGPLYPASNFFIAVDREVMWCSSRAGDVLTVVRGQLGTLPAAHTASAIVLHGFFAHHAEQATDAVTLLWMTVGP